MPRYIPYEQCKKLREAAKNGDERAIRILRAQLDDAEDFSHDLEDYFTPKEEPKTIEEVTEEQQPLITGEPTPNEAEISQKILDLIGACDKQTLEIANDLDISDATKKGALSILGEIKQSCLENLEKFGKLMSSITKKPKENEVVE